MTPQTSDPAAKADPFPHLPALRTAHNELQVRWEPDDRKPSEFLAKIHEFIARACASGAVLDADADRFAAQRLITYWVNVLCRERLPVPAETILEEYAEDVTVTLDEAARPYVTPGEAAQTSTDWAGWTRLIRECLQRLTENGLAAVVGHAGSGRRTLVTAGVLPQLRAGAVPGSDTWRLLRPLTPGAKPLAELVAALAPQVDTAIEVPAVRADPARLVALLDAGGGPAVVVIDHLEALFTTVERADIEPYLKALLALRDGKRHRVLLTLRSDSLPQMSGFEGMAEAIDRGRVFLMFTTRELRQAVEEPARRVGLRFDPGVVDRLLTDVQGDPAVIPLLQFSLLQLWEHRTGNRITRATYERLGGGRAALRRTADRVYQEFEQAGKDVVQKVLTAMVRQDLGREPDRQKVVCEDLRRLAVTAQ